jgi:hypothetical protein
VINQPLYGDAILRIDPTCEFCLQNNDIATVVFVKDEHPSVEEIEQEMELLRNEHRYEQFAVVRRNGYPPIGEQLDALFHAGVFPKEMAKRIADVKKNHPKPNDL